MYRLAVLNKPFHFFTLRNVQIMATPLGVFFWFFIALAAPWWATLVVLATVLVHEYGHMAVAERLKYKTEKLIFEPGGAGIRLDFLPQTSLHEIRIALAGPLVNLAVGLFLLPICLVLYYTNELSPVFFPVVVTCVLNFGVGLFNLIPIYPLDGGRVLRAWAIRTYGWDRGSRITRDVGLGVGALMFGALWKSNRRFAAVMFLFHLSDMVQALRAQEWLSRDGDGLGRMEEWTAYQTRWEKESKSSK